MTQSPDEYGDILRRVLRAEADAVVPSPDGLEIIRDRIERRGVRGVFWWRIGAAAVSAVLVAGTVVMVVPSLRERVITPTQIQPMEDSTTQPDNSSTKRPLEPSDPVKSQPAVVPPDPTPAQPEHQPTESAKSTAKPSPSPTPTPTPCPSSPDAAELDDCPEPTATSPTPRTSESPSPTGSCPPEECPPDDSPPVPPTELATPLTDNQVG
ncbi:hypothetical protein [Nonomuraea typhae]|uniref:hypothetical protein n=1 Tax=Nonomuraea typhae TaxID=2603600 RepID=UPI0012FC2AFB|nr:hypothetical protein [Nonomuraea typhae]